MTAASAYTMTDLPSLGEDDDEDVDRAFRDNLGNSIDVAADFLHQTEQGKNVSDIALGMFVSKVLGTLGARDKAISSHIFASGRFTEGYLVEVFQYHPAEEVAFFTRLSQAAANSEQARLSIAVAQALECLRHIPDAKEASPAQAKDRDDLAHALGALKMQLSTVAAVAANQVKGMEAGHQP